MSINRRITGSGLALLSTLAAAEPPPVAVDDAQLETVTVTATRIEQSAFDVPASVDVIGGSRFNEGTLGVNLSEGLAAVPGLLARDRQNYAQDTQISIRGFGSRASFGIRGLRLYLDGIPATQPDGQGQISHFNLATADRVEVLRGPFSTLYGNSSGGVIQMFTADGGEQTRISGGTAGGSFDTWRANLGASGPAGPGNYNVDFTWFDTEGFRDHSSARRESFNGKFSLPVGSAGKLSLLLNHFDSPDTQDPQGLTREQFDQDPSQAAPQPVTFNTRKSTEQSQAGLVYTHALNAQHELRALAYAGNREVEQFLSVPPAAQTGSELSSGGVIDLDSDYAGTDLRWTWRGGLRDRPVSLVAGLSYDELSQDRRGFENFIGEGETQQLGVRGALRRDEVNDIDNFDQYVQLSVDPHPRWNATLGLRHSKVSFDSADRYIVGANPDDSGDADYSETTPVAGLLFRAMPSLHLYGAYGEGFETPTFAEIAYRADGAAGLNLELDAARSDNAEVGAKLKLGDKARAQLALFHTRTEDEIVVVAASGGRSVFGNAGETRRQGVETLIEGRLLPRLNAQLAWTWLEAEVREDYAALATVERGNRLPGVAESVLFGALRWGGEQGLSLGLEARYVDEVPVNDVNAQSAPSYHLVGLDAGYVFNLPKVRVRTFLRVDNLFDEDYVGSLIVNDGNGRFFEPGPERNLLAGVRFDWSR